MEEEGISRQKTADFLGVPIKVVNKHREELME